MRRYSLIHTKLPREFVLLQGCGCRWRRCSFCDYHADTSANPYATNRKVLEQVTGEYGVLDIINSGSAMELDEQTIELIREVVITKNIHTLWFEAHYMYRHQLQQFAEQFAPTTVKFRCGVESFEPMLRRRWNKGIGEDVTPEHIATYFQGVCLLCCTEGDSRERIEQDIAIAQRYFEYFSLNIFCPNTTQIKQDRELAEWVKKELYPTIKDCPKVEILCENTDLGVG